MRPIPSGMAAFMQQVEGLKLYPYKDTAGVNTIYFGHVVKVGEFYYHTVEDAIKYLNQDLHIAAAAVSNNLPTEATDQEYMALISFAFNEGVHAFETSTLLKLYKAHDRIGAANQFLSWDKVKDPTTHLLIHSEGLLNRRKLERAMFLSGGNNEPGTS